MVRKLRVIILDKVPEIAASYLTTRDAKFSFRNLTEIIEDYKKGEEVAWSFVVSLQNFKWFLRFYVALGELLKTPVDIESLPKYNDNHIQHGLILPKYRVPRSFVYYREFQELKKKPMYNTVTHNRGYYLLKNYIASDFLLNKLPSWYISKSNVLWEGRDAETMCRVRITKDSSYGITIQTETTYNEWKTTQVVDADVAKVIRALLKNAL